MYYECIWHVFSMYYVCILFQASSSKFQVSSFEFQVSSFKFEVSSSDFAQVSSFKFQVSAPYWCHEWRKDGTRKLRSASNLFLCHFLPSAEDLRKMAKHAPHPLGRGVQFHTPLAIFVLFFVVFFFFFFCFFSCLYMITVSFLLLLPLLLLPHLFISAPN